MENGFKFKKIKNVNQLNFFCKSSLSFVPGSMDLNEKPGEDFQKKEEYQ
jgi:hypothetical protein